MTVVKTELITYYSSENNKWRFIIFKSKNTTKAKLRHRVVVTVISACLTYLHRTCSDFNERQMTKKFFFKSDTFIGDYKAKL